MSNVRMFRNSSSRARGIALIEVLIAMFVLVVGVVALSRMQGDFIGATATNKARSEAMAIAQSRLEGMRNYMHVVETEAEFNTLYAVATDANSVAVNGVNSAFTRSETIAADGDLRMIAVTVGWTDMAGDAQSVTLNTELMYSSPSGPAVLAADLAGPIIDAPTGRARLGDGTLPAGAPTTSNDDGTTLYNPGNGDLQLAVGDKIVLTLEQACSSDGSGCTDFVKINGTVYIDTATQGNLEPGEVFVLASDAAYCTRYYIDSNDVVQTVDIDTSSALTTDGGDYEYFDYTCYLGGGWHGNIGILLDGGIAQKDKVCQGDPTLTENDWGGPVIALRRAYRGMIYKVDGNGDEVKVGDDSIYLSQGIADATELPVSGAHSHDFVIASMSTSKTEDWRCSAASVDGEAGEEIMVRGDAKVGDAQGDRFAGNPPDFVCLNGYLDSYDTNLYGHRSLCPYDPTDPPTERHVVSGRLSVELEDTDDNDLLVRAMGIETSDGPGNCLVGTFSHDVGTYQANYECDVYDWGSGWNGSIQTAVADSDPALSCSPDSISLSSITSDNSGNDIQCSVGSDSGDPGSSSVATIIGTISPANIGIVLASVSIDGGSCTVAGDGKSYACETDSYQDSWSGILNYTLTGGYVCSGNAVISLGAVKFYGGKGSGAVYVEGIVGANTLNVTIGAKIKDC